ncbi:MAG: hypothetical protein RL398_3279 [Planctomycetota bacterium]|jgi:hypothetical protein
MLCQKIEPMVDGLAKEYEGKMKFAVVPHNEGDSQQRIAALGLEIHGMAITDAAGNKLWTESGHKQQRDVVKQAIDAALAR